MIPPFKDRTEIIHKSHLLGHFKLEITYNDISKTFWWKGMRKQCDHIIKNCMIYLLFSKFSSKNHPAFIDGFPVTIDGYCGILVITEYLTKYPYVVRIKNKSAKEIARHLFNYICLFGPPKVKLSDQGKEFFNQIVDCLLKLSGTEHIIT